MVEWLEWRTPAAEPSVPAREAQTHRGPSWATWGLVAAGLALAAGIAVGIAASGALQPASETRFISGGLNGVH
jgi:hypothetical protein